MAVIFAGTVATASANRSASMWILKASLDEAGFLLLFVFSLINLHCSLSRRTVLGAGEARRFRENEEVPLRSTLTLADLTGRSRSVLRQ